MSRIRQIRRSSSNGIRLDEHGKQFVLGKLSPAFWNQCAHCLDYRLVRSVPIKRKHDGCLFVLNAVYQFCETCRGDVAGAMAKVEKRCGT